MIISSKLNLKFVAINREKGGPNTTQQKKAIMQSTKTRTITFLLLDKFIKKFATETI
tara:strand:- start:256 stop:426 length:171 start_codon:yes stop_codon:yes gene_type:complete